MTFQIARLYQRPATRTSSNLVRAWILLGALSALAASARPAAAQQFVGNVDLPTLAPFGRMCINPETGRLYLPELFTNSIVVVDTQTNAVLYTLPAGLSPVDIVYDPVRNRVYVSDGDGVLVLDAANDTPLHRLLGVRFASLTVDPSGERIYAAYEATLYVLDVDAANTNAVVDRIDARDQFMSGVALSSAVNPVTRTVYFVDYWDVVVMNIDSHELIAVLPYSSGSTPLSGSVIDYQLNRIYFVTDFEVIVVDGNADRLLDPISVPAGARGGIALDAVTHRVYVTCFPNNTSSWGHNKSTQSKAPVNSLLVIDGTRNQRAALHPMNFDSVSLIVSPLTGLLYCAETWGFDLYVFQDVPSKGAK